jgi:ATP-dependent RNA helicase DeaD
VSVEDVNTTRLARFDDQITAALGDPRQIEIFRDVVNHYVRNHDVPEVDVAAALAIVAQGDTPLLLDPAAERARPTFTDRADKVDRPARGGRSGGDDRFDKGQRRPRHETGKAMKAYKIQVGKRHKVEPRQIVGAIANEGGLSRGDFGAIKIQPDFSVVELPADLSPEVFKKLEHTRISGKLIELSEDRGPRGSRPQSSSSSAPSAPSGEGAGEAARDKKPRHKKHADD